MTPSLPVTHWCTSSTSGGAGIAAMRLHRALLDGGVASRFRSLDDGPETITTPVVGSRTQPLVQEEIIALDRPGSGQTRFSLPTGGLADPSLLDHPGVQHLHWVNDLLGMGDLARLRTNGRPVVWTFHDHWPITGGCHYLGGCRANETDCGGCPQLPARSLGWAARLLRAKADLPTASRPVAVCPSRWMAEAAGRSLLWRDARIEHIPNAVDTTAFAPGDRLAARTHLGLPTEGPLLLFVADQFGERRKGYDLLLAALDGLTRRIPGLRCLAVGGAKQDSRGDLNPIIGCGHISDERLLRLHYVASDLVIVPSREDNLPNILLEASACGIPAVGFSVGGIPEAIIDRRTGLIAGTPSAEHLAEAVLEAFADGRRLAAWGAAAREHALRTYDAPMIARRHQDLYASLSGAEPGPSPAPHSAWPEVELVSSAAHQRVERLSGLLAVSERDREDRLAVINRQAAELAVVTEDHRRRGELIETMHRQQQEGDAARKDLDERSRNLESALLGIENERRPLLDALDAAQAVVFRLGDDLRGEREARTHAERSAELLRAQLAGVDQDRNERLLVIQRLDRELEEVRHDQGERGALIQRLDSELRAVSADRDLLRASAAELAERLAEAETDRGARLEVIQRQHREMEVLRGDHAERGALIAMLDAQVRAINDDRDQLRSASERLVERLRDVEADRAARLTVIERQHGGLQALAADHAARGRLLDELDGRLQAVEADRAARLEVIERQHEELQTLTADHAERGCLLDELDQRLQAVEADRAARLAVIRRQEQELRTLDADRAARLAIIERQHGELRTLTADHAERGRLLDELDGRLQAVEADRTGRLAIIERQHGELAGLRSEQLRDTDLLQQLQAELLVLQARETLVENYLRLLRDGRGKRVAGFVLRRIIPPPP